MGLSPLLQAAAPAQFEIFRELGTYSRPWVTVDSTDDPCTSEDMKKADAIAEALAVAKCIRKLGQGARCFVESTQKIDSQVSSDFSRNPEGGDDRVESHWLEVAKRVQCLSEAVVQGSRRLDFKEPAKPELPIQEYEGIYKYERRALEFPESESGHPKSRAEMERSSALQRKLTGDWDIYAKKLEYNAWTRAIGVALKECALRQNGAVQCVFWDGYQLEKASNLKVEQLEVHAKVRVYLR